LICPVDHLALDYRKGSLISASGRKYPVVDGVPVMLSDTVEPTIGVATASLERARADPQSVDHRAPGLYLESLAISEAEKTGLIELAGRGAHGIDPVVAYSVGATSGCSYQHLIGSLECYPIPELRRPAGAGKLFLDLGCNWGRWCIAAARKGYTVVGIDPSLGAIMAARRVAGQLRLPIRYLVADARYLPFRDASFDDVFSYSVLQHLSKANVTRVLGDVARVLSAKGTSLIQMPNALGARFLYHQAKRGLREARGFEVRYWSLPELERTFSALIGSTTITVDCFLGLGLQTSDIAFMPLKVQGLMRLSELLRKVSDRVSLLRFLADSVYVQSVRRKTGSGAAC